MCSAEEGGDRGKSAELSLVIAAHRSHRSYPDGLRVSRHQSPNHHLSEPDRDQSGFMGFQPAEQRGEERTAQQ